VRPRVGSPTTTEGNLPHATNSLEGVLFACETKEVVFSGCKEQKKTCSNKLCCTERKKGQKIKSLTHGKILFNVNGKATM
jgi:hypothetical protein